MSTDNVFLRADEDEINLTDSKEQEARLDVPPKKRIKFSTAPGYQKYNPKNGNWETARFDPGIEAYIKRTKTTTKVVLFI